MTANRYGPTREDRVEEVLELWMAWSPVSTEPDKLRVRTRQTWPELAKRLDALADAWDES